MHKSSVDLVFMRLSLNFSAHKDLAMDSMAQQLWGPDLSTEMAFLPLILTAILFDASNEQKILKQNFQI